MTATLRRRKWITRGASLAPILLASILLGHTAPADRALAAQDAPHLYVPIKQETGDALSRGEIPLWNEKVGCGVPFLANPMTQAAYPGNVLFVFLDAVSGLKVFVFLHLVLMALAFSRLASTFGVGALPALVAGLFFIGCGGVVSLHWNPLWTAGLPWMLLAMAEGRRLLHGSISHGSAIRLSGYVALMVLAGALEPLLAFGYYAFAECVAAGIRARREPDRRRALGKRYGLLAAAAFTSIGLAAFHLWPAFEFLREGARSTGVEETNAALWSLPPIRLLECIAPGLFGDAAARTSWSTLLGGNISVHLPYLAGLYVGAPAVILAGVGLVAARRSERWLLAGMLAITAVLAMGSEGPLFEVARLLPGVGLFRYPAKIFVISMIPFALFVGMGVERLLSPARPTSLPVRLGVVLAGGFLVGLVLSVLCESTLVGWLADRIRAAGADRAPSALVVGSRQALLHGLLVAAAVTALLGLRRRVPGQYAVAGALLLAVLDLALVNRELVPTLSTDEILQSPIGLPPPAALEDPAGRTRICELSPEPMLFLFQPYLASLHGYRSTVDYGSAELRSHIRLDRAVSTNAQLGLALTSSRFKLTLPPGKTVGSPLCVEPVEYSLPRATLFGRGVVAPDEDTAVGFMRSAAFDFNEHVVLLDAPATLGRWGVDGDAEEPGSRASLGTVRMTEDEATRVRLEVDAQRDAFLLLTDTWYPGWEATLDGDVVPHYCANLAFRALPVPAGEHEVVFRYRPASLAWGCVVSGLAVVGAWIWLAAAWFSSRSNPSSRVARQATNTVETAVTA